MKKIILIDNYDSFSYNLVHYLEDLNADVTVVRNDEISPEDCEKYDAVVLSPGPGIPSEAGNLLPIIQYMKDKKPLLGICLGHQAITEVFGGEIINLEKVYHGLSTKMIHRNDELFKDIPSQFDAGRYHSWVAKKESFPDELQITATDENNQIMALRHSTLPIYGVQFHPESIMTPHGKKMLANFLNII
ncbi:anthranilate synthase [Nonlabens tegetincola]|uniref:Anthranilate synthase n=1 Tax=Nonlabens tegetincola TaxID=323273 RepID=A0A090Q4X1_9FLAO|nr:aminodeoxychorismate/anthranilate synthase component II [Nonlabens tegetincola]GAK97252.1 anthranilate synthase [Nonlabens tegetincola]